MTDMVATDINGRWTVVLPDYRAERVQWSDPGWEVKRLSSMCANLGPGDLVYDIGTEEGDLTALYAQWGCDLVLCEPNPRVWPNIRAIWDANHLAAPVAWWTGFVTNHGDTPDPAHYAEDGWPGYVDLPLRRDHGFLSVAESGDRIPGVTIDTLARTLGRPPTAITVDVEGAEMLVLEGAPGVLDDARPLVWVSVHDEMIRYDYGYTSESVHQFMALHGYRMQLLEIDHECHWFYWPAERDVIL